VRSSLLLRVCEVLAAHADHGSGRHCAVTNAVAAAAADCSTRTVTTVRRLIAQAGLAIEVRRGTGTAHTPTRQRRPSIWHLVSRRKPVHNHALFHLPPSRRDRRITPVKKNSPSGRTRPPRKSASPQKQPKAPRPLGLQRLAAAVIARSVGLSHVHPGHICDALTRSGLDLDAWSAQQLTSALNADMRARGWSWPNRIEKPGAFLASRLRRLPERPEPAAIPAATAPIAADIAPSAPASAATRAAARAYFQQNRTKKSTNTPSQHTTKNVKCFTYLAGRACASGLPIPQGENMIANSAATPQTHEWEIPAYNLDAFQAKIADANNRLSKAGLTARFEVSYEDFEVKKNITHVDRSVVSNHAPVYVYEPWVRATLTGPLTLRHGHFTFVASLLAEEAGITVHSAPGHELGGYTPRGDNGCDHCKVERSRSRLYLVRDDRDATIIQLGHSLHRALHRHQTKRTVVSDFR
jgi:hypothetical protein